MELRRDLDYALGSLLIGGVALALVTIGLFGRMSPAIERIREDNVVTLTATHTLLSVFVRRVGAELELGDREIVERALTEMRDNLTVEGEGRLVDAVTDAVLAAQSGDRQAFVQLVAAVDTLTTANSKAMIEADLEAQRLGTAGAWTASLGGLLLVLIGVYARARLRRRLIAPVEEVARVLEARADGDGLARCRAMEGAVELERTLSAVNKLLDARHGGAPKEPNKRRGTKRRGPRLELAPATVHALALQGLLAEKTGPWLVTSAEFGLVAANDEGFERLAEHQGPELLARLVSDDELVAKRTELGDGLTLIGLR